MPQQDCGTASCCPDFTAKYPAFTAHPPYFFNKVITYSNYKLSGESAMYHKLAQKATIACLRRNWISYEQLDWCLYAIEKRINYAAVFFSFLIIALLSNSIIEIFTFTFCVVALRSRLGGWHAKRSWSCQLVGLISMLISVFVIGPCIEWLNTWYIVPAILIISLTILFTKPIYPAQLHFTERELCANNKRKNCSLLTVVLLQWIGSIILGWRVAIYGALGMLVSLIALFVEKYARRKNNNEKN